MNANTKINSVVVSATKNAEQTQQQVKTYNGFDADSRLDWDIFEAQKVGNYYVYSNAELAVQFRTRLQRTFHDCMGVVIYPAINGNFPCSIIFKYNPADCPEDKIRSLVDVTKINKSSKPNFYDYRMKQMNDFNGVKYELNDETKLLLAEFMYGGKKANMPESGRWKNNIIQQKIQTPVMYGMGAMSNNIEIYIEVINVNFRALLRKLFGNTLVLSTVKDESGRIVNYTGTAKYQPRILKSNPDGTFNIAIDQFSEQKIDELYSIANPSMCDIGVGYKIY
jgi:hypothetical protein